MAAPLAIIRARVRMRVGRERGRSACGEPMAMMRMTAVAVVMACIVPMVRAELAKHDNGLLRMRWREDGYLGGRHNYTTLCQNRFCDCIN